MERGRVDMRICDCRQWNSPGHAFPHLFTFRTFNTSFLLCHHYSIISNSFSISHRSITHSKLKDKKKRLGMLLLLPQLNQMTLLHHTVSNTINSRLFLPLSKPHQHTGFVMPYHYPVTRKGVNRTKAPAGCEMETHWQDYRRMLVWWTCSDRIYHPDLWLITNQAVSCWLPHLNNCYSLRLNTTHSTS